MGRISQEEKAANQARYDDIVFSMFVNEGWDKVTLGTVSKRCGIPKSTLQSYYPTKAHFGKALRGRIMPMIAHAIDCTSRKGFVKSWTDLSRENRVFRESLKMMVSNIVNQGGNPGNQAAIKNYIEMLRPNLGDEEARAAVIEALGETLYSYSFEHPEPENAEKER